ncbi:MAG: branched-chain amino acid transport system II carrier protein [Capnocytophaga sp.]|nr:branched-chain amino acid transport system II carrier protein [Capnocytophaga sp.]
MNKIRLTLASAFMGFSMIFGAGNLILPPYLGLQAGVDWWQVALGFSISSVLVSALGILAHARLQGTIMDFSSTLSSKFGLVYCVIIYAICLILPSPRTASVSYEMAIGPYFDISPLVFSFVYFALTLLVVFNRAKIIEIIGEYLTPIILVIISAMVFITLFSEYAPVLPSRIDRPLFDGLLEGYQTFDAIAGIVVGGVLVVSLDLKGGMTYKEKRTMITWAAVICALSLFLIYAGLTYVGAAYGTGFPPSITRTELMSGLGYATLGKFGNMILVTLVSLACFTTAVGIVAGAADFIKKITGGSRWAYRITAVLGCVFGVLVGQLEFQHILNITVPFLLFTYPVTIMLILLNNTPRYMVNRTIFAGVMAISLFFGVIDAIRALGITVFDAYLKYLPLFDYSLAWLLPSLFVWLFLLFFKRIFSKKNHLKK